LATGVGIFKQSLLAVDTPEGAAPAFVWTQGRLSSGCLNPEWVSLVAAQPA
jgi:hypothetical protein